MEKEGTEGDRRGWFSEVGGVSGVVVGMVSKGIVVETKVHVNGKFKEKKGKRWKKGFEVLENNEDNEYVFEK